MNRIGRVAGNHDASLPIPPVNVCRGNSRQQCLCVGVFGGVIDIPRRTRLDDAPGVHADFHRLVTGIELPIEQKAVA